MSMIGETPTLSQPQHSSEFRTPAVKLVVCDAQGKPRRQRLIGLDWLLRQMPPTARQGAATAGS